MATKANELNMTEMRSAMIDSQLRTSDVIDPAVLAAMAAVPREEHVPEALASVSYMDRPVALNAHRVLNPPLAIGRLLVAADIQAGVRVLLIGAATGYVARLLAHLGAEVFAVESDADLLAVGRRAANDPKIHWVEGPLPDGAPDGAPFDRLFIDGAVDVLPDELLAQLADGGRLVGVVRDGAVTRLVQGVKVAGTVVPRSFADMDVPMLPGFAAPATFRF